MPGEKVAGQSALAAPVSQDPAQFIDTPAGALSHPEQHRRMYSQTTCANAADHLRRYPQVPGKFFVTVKFQPFPHGVEQPVGIIRKINVGLMHQYSS